MPITDVTSALELINQIVEKDAVKINTPISKKTYIVTPLQGEDDIVLKKSIKSNAEFVENLVKVICKHAKKEDGKYAVFNEFVKENSMQDLTSLVYGLLCATYKEEKEYKFICNSCGKENVVKNLKYSNFKLKGQTWDKEEPFYSYRYKIEYKVNDNLTLEFITKLPTIYDTIQTSKVLNKEFAANENFLDIPLIDLALAITDEFVIKIKNNDNVQEKKYTNVYDLKILFEKLPESILSFVKDKYNEHFSKYITYYAYNAKCEFCTSENELVLNPEITLLTKVFGT